MCFICNGRKTQNYTRVAVWTSTASNPVRFGLASANEDGETCCSFNEGIYATRKEAEEAVLETDINEIASEAHYEEYDSSYGPSDSDPYDVEQPQW